MVPQKDAWVAAHVQAARHARVRVAAGLGERLAAGGWRRRDPTGGADGDSFIGRRSGVCSGEDRWLVPQKVSWLISSHLSWIISPASMSLPSLLSDGGRPTGGRGAQPGRFFACAKTPTPAGDATKDDSMIARAGVCVGAVMRGARRAIRRLIPAAAAATVSSDGCPWRGCSGGQSATPASRADETRFVIATPL